MTIDIGTAYIMMALAGINVLLCAIYFVPPIFKFLTGQYDSSNGRGLVLITGVFAMVSEIGAVLCASNIYDLVKDGGTIPITNMFTILYMVHTLCAIVAGIAGLIRARMGC